MPDSSGDGAERPRYPDGSPDRPRPATRRRLLAAGGSVAAAMLAGCSGVVERGEALLDSGSGGDAGNSTAGPTGTGSATPTGTATATPTPETDVVGLVHREADGGRTFIVTLSPPDDSGGADWWQLETLDGDRVVRESFDEPRTGDRFTTDRTLELGDTSKLVVRGHDAAFGYGGQVILVDLDGPTLRAERQGEEPASFADYSF